MALKYQITYQATNTYETPLREALWQFLIIPLDNDTQIIQRYSFSNSRDIPHHESIDGFGNQSLRLRTKQPIDNVEFTAVMELLKKEINPFDSIANTDPQEDFKVLEQLEFRVDHESFLTPTVLTEIPKDYQNIFQLDKSKGVFNNLQDLNKWCHEYFTFRTEVTDTETGILEILEQKQGVCQDFTHVFCGLARIHKIPTRYVSGYLHQDSGLVGDLQMHAWVECYVPGNGWVGFDPTNNLLAASNHIKVTHGRDYTDCAPIKGVVYLSGGGLNETSYTVRVKTVEDFSEPRPDLANQLQSQTYGSDQVAIRQRQWQQQQQ